jgi:DNA repair protein RAD51
MTQANLEQGQDDSGYEEGLAGGPGAPMPLNQLAVCLPWSTSIFANDISQGQDGLTARDIQLVIDGGYHTVEAVAYT